MADITVTPAKVAAVRPQDSKILSYVATSAITAGDPVYITTAGKAGVADANASGTKQFRGIALKTVGTGMAVDVLEDGEVYGFTLSGNADTRVYLSNNVGRIADAAGSTSVTVGRVVCLPDAPTFTKVLRVFTQWATEWA